MKQAGIDRGLHDELNDGHYIMVDAEDGRIHHTALNPKQDMDDLPIGAIVEVHPASINLKSSDRIIIEIVRTNDGIYSPDYHAEYDSSASSEFVQAHARRLEALRRKSVVRRFADGSWEIPDNFAELIANQQKTTGRFPGKINTLSSFSLESQIQADGATWLDRRLLSRKPNIMRNSRFGEAVKIAQQARQKYLIEQGLAEEQNGSICYRRNLLNTLQQCELQTSGNRIAKESKTTFV